MSKRFHIITYGCQMNVYDSRVVAEILRRQGWEEVDSPEVADVIMVNTCTVRAHAERRALGRLRVLVGLKRQRPVKVGVLGCMAQHLKEKVFELVPGLDFAVGPDGYERLPELIEAGGAYFPPLTHLYTGIHPQPDRPYSAFVTIMRGCDSFCTYCIVPYVRGRVRSRPVNDILEEIQGLLDRGIKEIILIGQNVNLYNYDGIDFTKLLDKVADMGIERIGFLTSHPKYFDMRVIEVIASHPNIIRELHLPVQAGSNKVLHRMNRGYTREEYLALIDRIREAIPDVALTTDIMVGFPGETEADFEATLELVKHVRFHYAYMFKYSMRPGTVASKWQDDVPETEKLRRLRELIQLQNSITRERRLEMIDNTYEVLVERKSRKGDEYFGRTIQNIPVVIDGDVQPGDTVRVRIIKLVGCTPYGVVSG